MLGKLFYTCNVLGIFAINAIIRNIAKLILRERTGLRTECD